MARGGVEVPPGILQEAAEPILARIRADVARVKPVPVGKLLRYLAEHLFDEGLTITAAKRATGIRGNTIVELCQLQLRCSPRRYLEERRAEIATRLREQMPELSLEQIAEAIGVGSAKALAAKLKRHRAWQALAPAPEMVPAEPAEGGPAEELLNITRSPAQRAAFEKDFVRRAQLSYLLAMPRRARRSQEITFRFRGPAFFHAALRVSREGCRDDRQRGVWVAERALEGLRRRRGSMPAEEFALLEIEGLVAVGHAHRLATHPQEARTALNEAKAAVVANAPPPALVAEVLALEGVLLSFDRRYEEASAVLSQAIDLQEAAAEPRLLVKLLLFRAFVSEALGTYELGRADLEQALGLVVASEDLYLRAELAVRFTRLALLLGDHADAERSLAAARQLACRLAMPCVWHQVWWLEGLHEQEVGDLHRAEERFLAAKVGFESTGAVALAATVALDHAILCTESGRSQAVPALLVQTLQVLESLGFEHERLEAVRLMGRCVGEGTCSLEILQSVRAWLGPICGAPVRNAGERRDEGGASRPRQPAQDQPNGSICGEP